MKEKKTKKIDFSRKRIAHIADEYYNEGDFLSALRFAHRELREFGGDPDVYARLCDIYEGMGLQGSSLNYWFRFLDVAEESDLPDIYEGLAANFLALGNERAAAYYYDRLVDSDENLPEETKLDIVEAFAQDKRDKFRFTYPPELADYSNEISLGGRALKAGDCKRAIAELDKVAVGSKEYNSAKEMQAVAYLLDGDVENAERVCLEVLEKNPDELRVLATLAAVYLEQEKKEESLAIAKRLAALPASDTDDAYKIATVCCENGLHGEAYERFALLDKKAPYDGRTLYFTAVSAYKSGRLNEAIDALERLVTVYPDAEVARYYLRQLRAYKEALEEGENVTPPELIYFYHLPQEEREERCRLLIRIGECPQDEAQLFGLIALHDGYFAWCFDEMDGGDRDLQYLALVTAVRVRADEFLQDVLLDFEVADVLKVETLRMLLERNEDLDVGIVLCGIYKRAPLYRIAIGRKRRKRFIEGYARAASKFAAVGEEYARKIQSAAEKLYRSLEEKGGLDLVECPDDCACAIYLCSGLKDLGKEQKWIASAFNANLDKVRVLLSYTLRMENVKSEERKNEID